MNDIETIKEIYRRYWKCMIDKDESELRSLMSDDYYLMHITGTRQSIDEFISGLLDGTFNYYSAEHDDIQISVNGNTATMVGKSKVLAAVYGGGKSRWRLRGDFTLRKENEKLEADKLQSINLLKEEQIMEYVTLNNGVSCPVVGIGTFMLTPADAENSVREALKMGYSLVDTANAYVNERACGRGIKNSGMKREDVFLSTKLWPSEYENDNAVDETLERLGVDYVDLLYIHQPAGNWLAGYRQLEKAYKEGKAKAIGISNFEGKYIEELQTKWEIVPQFIQVEAHPYFTQKELRQVLDIYDIKLMSWYPLGHGDKSLINESLFAELGRKYGKSSAQVILRWHTQMGFVVIPGSKNVDHIKDNLDILDFTLTKEEMAEIAKLDKNQRYYHRTDEQLVQFAGWRPSFEQK